MYMVLLGVGAGANIGGYKLQCTWSYLVWELVLI